MILIFGYFDIIVFLKKRYNGQRRGIPRGERKEERRDKKGEGDPMVL